MGPAYKSGAGEAWIERHCADPSSATPPHAGGSLLRSYQWQDRFLVGHPEIDADHRRFFDHFRDMASCVDDPGAGAALDMLFTDCVADLIRHHATEEHIVARHGFAGLAEHKSRHRTLAYQAKAALAMGRDGEWMTALMLLSTLVLEHVAMEDANFRTCFARVAAAG